MNCHQKVGPDHPGDNIDAITFHQTVGKLFRHIRLTLVIGENHFGIHAAKLSACMFHCQVHSILHLLANDSGGA